MTEVEMNAGTDGELVVLGKLKEIKHMWMVNC